jgi:hypothetical protein
MDIIKNYLKNTCDAMFLGHHIVCTRNRKSYVIPYRDNIANIIIKYDKQDQQGKAAVNELL